MWCAWLRSPALAFRCTPTVAARCSKLLNSGKSRPVFTWWQGEGAVSWRVGSVRADVRNHERGTLAPFTLPPNVQPDGEDGTTRVVSGSMRRSHQFCEAPRDFARGCIDPFEPVQRAVRAAPHRVHFERRHIETIFDSGFWS